MNDHDDTAAEVALFDRLRAVWEAADPVPAELADRMVAAVAVADLGREYALLTLVSDAEPAAVRGDADTATLRFSDGTTGVLLRVSSTEGGLRRVDGWVDGDALAVRLVQGEREWEGDAGARGRFAFDDVAPGVSRVRLVVREAGELREFQTPPFEV